MKPGIKDEEYLKALKRVVTTSIIPFDPQFLVVSLGLDTFSGDPVGAFDLSTDAFPKLGQLIKSINIPTLFVMEGGYAVKELGENVVRVLVGFQQ